MTMESSVCFHNKCRDCPLVGDSRQAAESAWVVDVAIERAKAVKGFVTVAELGGFVRELTVDYGVNKFQGQILGAASLGLSGDCEARQEMNKLMEGTL